MSDGTHIEWTDATWQIVTGCSVVSPGCANCYAMRLAGTRLKHHVSREGLTIDTKAGPVWTGEVRFNEQWLTQPLHWKKPRKVFVAAHGDLFHEKVEDIWLDQAFAVMALARHHTFQVLTKRPDRMRDYFDGPWWGRVSDFIDDLKPSALWNGNVFQAKFEVDAIGYLPNVWLGTSVEDQLRADERIPALIETPAAVRWLSCEPLLGALNLLPWLCVDDFGRRINWVVVGGESGPGARPMHPRWARQLRDQCAMAEVPYLFKQWGAWVDCDTVGMAPTHFIGDRGKLTRAFEALPEPNDGGIVRVGKGKAGRLLDSVQHDGYPA